MLLSLPKSYDTIVTAIETIDPSTLTVDFVKTRLLDEFNKRKSNEHESGKDDSGVAMYVKSGKFKFQCYKCGETGHMKRDCKKDFKNKSKNQANVATEDKQEEQSTKTHEVAFMTSVETNGALKCEQNR